MPGELKNLVALAVSSGSSKYHHHQQQQQQQQEKKSAAESAGAKRGAGEGRSGAEKKRAQIRRSKEESNSGAKRFTKLLSKSVGAVSSTIATSSAPLLPPSDSVAKKAPVASPESEGSSLLNGGSCGSATDHATGQAYPTSYDPALPNCAEVGDESPSVTAHSRSTNEAAKTWSAMNGSAIVTNGRDGEECSADEASEEHSRSAAMRRHRCSADASRGAETDDETILSSVAGGTLCGNTTSDEVGACKAPSTSALTASATAADSGERSRGWYATRKAYRSVAYKTWTVGAARKLLNSSRSDYDLPPSAMGQDASRSTARIGPGKLTDGSVSDGEEKFFSCAYSRSQDDDLDRDAYLSTISGMQTSDSSDALTLADLNKMKAKKCASSDAVTLFASARDSNSFLSPVDSVPSTSSDKTSSLSQPLGKLEPEVSATNGDSDTKDPRPGLAPSTLYSSPNPPVPQGRSSEKDRLRPNGPDPVSGPSKIGNDKSWLRLASPSSSDVWRDENGEGPHSRSVREENNNKNPVNRIKHKPGSRSTGDCFSSEDYFKFTLKKRLLQQRQQQQLDFGEDHNGGREWGSSISRQRDVTPPLLALDRDIRAALHNFDDFNNKTARSGSPTRRQQVRSSSPTTLASLMASAQQRWKQQSERFTRRMERASCRAKIENSRPISDAPQSRFDPFPPPPPRLTEPRTPPPLPPTTLIRIATGQLSSSSFSSNSSSSSSMSWISQGQAKQTKQRLAVCSPLAISVDANGDHGEDWTPSDPGDAGKGQRRSYCFPMRSRSKTTTATAGANSPFQSSDEAMQFLKKELEVIRKKDHQILTQLKLLDAEISRRRSETDALASIRSSEFQELENGQYPVEEPGPLLSKTISKPASRASDRPRAYRLANGTPSRALTHLYSNSLHTSVPPMPKCLEVNFKTL